jgi:putative multiple sugar transport system ATP-binding protein
LVSKGKSVLFISSDMPEILGMCDRTYVMNEGAIVGELIGSEITQVNIMNAIMRILPDIKASPLVDLFADKGV